MQIVAKHLTKEYVVNSKENGLKGMIKSLFYPETKTVSAVQDVSFEIEEGEFVGYIGPNGAGKSTTIKMLSGILTPTDGKVEVCGIDPIRNRIENAMNIGAVFGQKTQMWWDLPVRESFELLRRMYNIPFEEYKKNVKEYMEVLEIGSFINQAVRQLSLGQRMRAEIAAALLHNPHVLFLDEPTIGLDINVKTNVRSFLKKINKEKGVTILLTTHDLQDIEQLAKRIIVINHGCKGFDGSINELMCKFSKVNQRISFILQNSVENIELPERMLEHCTITKNGMHVAIEFEKEILLTDLMSALLQRYQVSDIDIQGPNIEDVVMEMYRQ